MRDLRKVVGRFESLGGGARHDHTKAYGCEFARFQRQARVQSISLLRWANIPFAGLVQGLNERFSGLDDIDTLNMLRVSPTAWRAAQSSYNISTAHTGLSYADYTPAQAQTKFHKSFLFMRDKLLQDLDAAEKVFVYRIGDDRLTDAELDQLDAAIKTFRARLLYVYVDENQPYRVERKSDFLLICSIDRFSPVGDYSLRNDAGWEKVCRATLAALDGEIMPRQQPHDMADPDEVAGGSESLEGVSVASPGA